jgi:hypothetical protein
MYISSKRAIKSASATNSNKQPSLLLFSTHRAPTSDDEVGEREGVCVCERERERERVEAGGWRLEAGGWRLEA